jgi:hypothetical protein
VIAMSIVSATREIVVMCRDFAVIVRSVVVLPVLGVVPLRRRSD